MRLDGKVALTIDGGALCHQALPEIDFEGMRAGQGA